MDLQSLDLVDVIDDDLAIANDVHSRQQQRVQDEQRNLQLLRAKTKLVWKGSLGSGSKIINLGKD